MDKKEFLKAAIEAQSQKVDKQRDALEVEREEKVLRFNEFITALAPLRSELQALGALFNDREGYSVTITIEGAHQFSPLVFPGTHFVEVSTYLLPSTYYINFGEIINGSRHRESNAGYKTPDEALNFVLEKCAEFVASRKLLSK